MLPPPRLAVNSRDGGGGNDTLIGGPGVDVLDGRAGNDTLVADDGAADERIDGGPGLDTASLDCGVDAAPLSVETTNC